MLSEFEKLIYNKHLYHYKKAQSKPFSFRKNFDKLDESTIFYVKKLAMFFNKFKHINIDTFFISPYKIYTDEKYFDLKFYISPKAIKTYTLYNKNIETQNPDNEDVLSLTTESLRHIREFCNKNNVKVESYLDVYEKNNTLPAFIQHLHEQKTNFYCLFGFNNFKEKLFVNYESYRFVLGSVIDSYTELYNNFIKSKKLKILVREGIKKIS